MRRVWQAILLTAAWCSGTISLHAETPRNPLLGKWKHTSKEITLSIEANRLHFVAAGDKPFSLHADYGSTRDQTVFGLVTRVEGERTLLQQLSLNLLDEPFCFRVRAEDNVLVIRGMNREAMGDLLEGIYKPAAALGAEKSDLKLPPLETPVPSCGMYGDRLDSLTLRDLDGKVWNYKCDGRGRLTLLDFWYHSCGPCLKEIPNLIELQREYGSKGLEIIGIACESGSLEEQRRNVRAIRNRYQITYKTLLSGGGPEHCPVIAQFHVALYPTLILIDENGRVVWRSGREGMDDYARQRLRKMIADKLDTE
jgi:thiol-disulfide isomerase/thioredoxin